MWEGLLTGLSDEDVDALLDYLESLQHLNEGGEAEESGRVAGAVGQR